MEAANVFDLYWKGRIMIWHPLRTNPLDCIGRRIVTDTGAEVRIAFRESGPVSERGFVLSAGAPLNRRIAGLSNLSACYALNAWNAQLV